MIPIRSRNVALLGPTPLRNRIGVSSRLDSRESGVETGVDWGDENSLGFTIGVIYCNRGSGICLDDVNMITNVGQSRFTLQW